MAVSEPGDPPAASRGDIGSASGKVESIVGARRLLTINGGSSKDPRVHLVGYGPSASTIGANRAGRAAARELIAFLGEEKS
jgi:hypothetical protein